MIQTNLKEKYKIHKDPHYSALIKLDNFKLAFRELENKIISYI